MQAGAPERGVLKRLAVRTGSKEVTAGHSRTVAPTAAAQPAGTPHTDPALGERGWQADSHGVYVRNPEAEASSGISSPGLTQSRAPPARMRSTSR